MIKILKYPSTLKFLSEKQYALKNWCITSKRWNSKKPPDDGEEKKLQVYTENLRDHNQNKLCISDKSCDPKHTVCDKEKESYQYDPFKLKEAEINVKPLEYKEVKPAKYCPCGRGGPCAPRKKVCLPRPPPPPPPPPFPWKYILPIPIFLAACGMIYKLYLFLYDRSCRNCAGGAKDMPFKTHKVPYYCVEFPKKVQYLIIGAGTAGSYAYKAIKDNDPLCQVLFVNAEEFLPYDRSSLSKRAWLTAEKPPPLRSWMEYMDESAFVDVDQLERSERPAVAIAKGWRAGCLDADEHVVYIKKCGGIQANQDWCPIEYEKCLIATGSIGRQIGVFKYAPREVRNHVVKLRTVKDFERAWRILNQKYVARSDSDDTETPKLRCTIVGGGTLATELSWVLGRYFMKTDRGSKCVPVEIVHILRDNGVLRRIVPNYLGEWLVEKLKDEGVQFITKEQIYDAFVNPDNGRLTLHLSSGKEMDTDLVMVCAGAVPDTRMAKNSHLEVDGKNGGYLVNTELMARTDLYAAGDAASLYRQMIGKRMRTEHLLDAQTTGELAGINMTGKMDPYNIPQHFFVKFGLKGEVFNIEAVGDVSVCHTSIGVFSNEETAKEVHQVSRTQVAQPLDLHNIENVAECPAEEDAAKPCYKKTAEYRNRYNRGIVFYLKGVTIVGMVFWNMECGGCCDERRGISTEIIRAEPTYDDIEQICHLFGLVGHEEHELCHVDEEERILEKKKCCPRMFP